MDEAHDGTAHGVVEAFGQVGMNGIARIFLCGGVNRIVLGKLLAGRLERLPFIAQQMGERIDVSLVRALY
jgi:hypothetical protein